MPSEQGLSMQTETPLEASRRIELHLNLPEPATHLDTTGYIAWADALGRAGVRCSELPEMSRQRLEQWLALHSSTPSRRAPKLSLTEQAIGARSFTSAGDRTSPPGAISLEAGPEALDGMEQHQTANSSTMQYEFHSLGSDLNAALRLVGARACPHSWDSLGDRAYAERLDDLSRKHWKQRSGVGYTVGRELRLVRGMCSQRQIYPLR